MKAWKTRKKKGWKRKTIADKKKKLLAIAQMKLSGSYLQSAERALSKRYRSKARERDIVEKWGKKLEKIKVKKA